MVRNFDQLRADIWRFAAKPELSERQLIQRLLDTVGPALGVDRACFNEPDGDEMKCTLEWVGPGIKPSVGYRLPHLVQAQFVRPYPLEITLESSIEALPAWLRPIGAPALVALAAALNLASVLIVPYSVVGGVVDGVLSFDVSRGRGVSKGWSEPLLPVIYEVALIVGQAIARKRAEAAQSASERRYRTLVENLGEGVGVLSPEEVFVFANRAGEQIFGVETSGLAGRNLRSFLSEDSCTALDNPRGARQTSSLELEIQRDDGSRRMVELTRTPEQDPSGQLASTLAIFRDVTDQRAAERLRRSMDAQVQRAQKLGSLGVLAGGIAHDFNNVLMGILGHAQLALQQLPANSEASESLEQIRKAALHTSGLTRQLLTYSGKGTVVVERVDLSRIVQEMAELLCTAVSKKAEIRLRLAENLAPLEGDSGQMRQIVINLLTNASDALLGGAGIIEVCTGEMRLDAERLAAAQIGAEAREGSHVFLEVRDTGCGMTPDSQAQMFDPFFSTKFAGRGLGLAAVLGIVRAHHGAIYVDSAVGKGTCVRVCFPASPALVASSLLPLPATLSPQPAASYATVLIAEDDPFVLSSTSRLLRRAGFTVMSSCNGREAVELFLSRPNKISIVLLDMTMPEKSGLEALRELRQVKPDLPAILCSGYCEAEFEVEPAQARLTAFLQKPYEQDALLRALRNLLASQTA